jgi:hypothetical protein
MRKSLPSAWIVMEFGLRLNEASIKNKAPEALVLEGL